jgi:hypothetical protein
MREAGSFGTARNSEAPHGRFEIRRQSPIGGRREANDRVIAMLRPPANLVLRKILVHVVV